MSRRLVIVALAALALAPPVAQARPGGDVLASRILITPAGGNAVVQTEFGDGLRVDRISAAGRLLLRRRPALGFSGAAGAVTARGSSCPARP